MRQFTLQGLVERASERIGIKGRVIAWQQAEPCMDVDKPHQLEIMREDIAAQQRKAAPPKNKIKAKAKVKQK
jgi:hypothetical protein